MSNIKEISEITNPCQSVVQIINDIVKAHDDGELKVTTKEGEGSEFIIQLPIA